MSLISIKTFTISFCVLAFALSASCSEHSGHESGMPDGSELLNGPQRPHFWPIFAGIWSNYSGFVNRSHWNFSHTEFGNFNFTVPPIHSPGWNQQAPPQGQRPTGPAPPQSQRPIGPAPQRPIVPAPPQNQGPSPLPPRNPGFNHGQRRSQRRQEALSRSFGS